MNPIVYAIPVFFALMALEWAVAHARGQRAFRLGDTINSVGLGAISQISGLYARLLGFGVYVAAYEALALWQLPADAWWVWALGLATAASRTTNPLLLGLIVAVAVLMRAAS